MNPTINNPQIQEATKKLQAYVNQTIQKSRNPESPETKRTQKPRKKTEIVQSRTRETQKSRNRAPVQRLSCAEPAPQT
jgi:hypothetical protein